MNIYDFNKQNDFLNAQVICVGMNVPQNEHTKNSIENLFPDSQQISDVLTWGCSDPSIKFEITNKDSLEAYSWAYSFIEEVQQNCLQNKVVTRKIDMKNKRQWLD
jgi:hypothetical protein